MQGESRIDRELLDAAALVGHLVPAGSVFAFLAEHRREVFPDEMFADLFGSGTGRPSLPVDVAASVLVLQALYDTSDRETAEACAAISGGRWHAGWRWTMPGFTRPH